MALQLGATRDALLSAGVPPDKAGAVAEELAGYDNRLASIARRLTLLNWMVGITLALSIAILWRVFLH